MDSIYDIIPLLKEQKFYIRFPKAKHEDFSCLPHIGRQIIHIDTAAIDLYEQINLLALHYFDLYLKKDKEGFSIFLNHLCQQEIGKSDLPVVKDNRLEGKSLLTGKVTDFKTGEPLPYVNVGIPNKNIGTITQPDGIFKLSVGKSFSKDSIKFSMIGYENKMFSIKDILNSATANNVRLKEKKTVLNHVIIHAKALKTKTLGNTTRSKFFSAGFGSKDLGSEVGIVINLGRKPVLLKSFNFNISHNRSDTAVFRVNIYKFKNGLPAENILNKNILIKIKKRQTGSFSVNLTDYHLWLKDKIFISLEWIQGTDKKEEAIFFSAGLLNSSTYVRKTSQGDWKKHGGIGVGFNVMVGK